MSPVFRFLLFILIGLAAAATYDSFRRQGAPTATAPLVVEDPLFAGLELTPDQQEKAAPAIERFLLEDARRRAEFRAKLNEILTPAQRRELEDRRWAGMRGDFRELNPTRDQENRIEALLAEARPGSRALAKILLDELKPILDPQQLVTLEARLQNRYGRPRASSSLAPLILA